MAKRGRDELREIGPDWLTKQEVADKVGRSLSAITRLQTNGRLNPLMHEDGTNRYDPEEVQDVVDDPPVRGPATMGGRKEEFAEYELSVVKEVIDLIRVPRQQIDELLFKIINRQEAQLDRLIELREKDRAIVEGAKDNQAERDVATNILTSEQRIKEVAANRFLSTISALFTKGQQSGVQLTPDQLEALLGEAEFFTPEQANEAKKAVLIYKETIAKEAKEAALKEAVKTKVVPKPTVDTTAESKGE